MKKSVKLLFTVCTLTSLISASVACNGVAGNSESGGGQPYER